MNPAEFLGARIDEDEQMANLRDRAKYGPPIRSLREVEAKRRIVEAYQDAEDAVATYDSDNPTPAYWQEWGNRHAWAEAVERLAAIYADHPDYDEEWRP